MGDVGDPPHRGPSGQSGIGSRSIRHSSGFSTSARREFHGWNSTVDICTAQITWASSVTHSSSAVRFVAREVTRTVSSHGGAPCGTRFWCTFSPRDALGEPVQHAGPLAQRVDDAVAHREVVVDQVELGLAPRREVDPVGVGDPHVALADLQLDRG